MARPDLRPLKRTGLMVSRSPPSGNRSATPRPKSARASTTPIGRRVRRLGARHHGCHHHDAHDLGVRRRHVQASAIHMNVFGLSPVVVLGSKQQCRRMLPDIVTGKEKFCFAITAPYRPQHDTAQDACGTQGPQVCRQWPEAECTDWSWATHIRREDHSPRSTLIV